MSSVYPIAAPTVPSGTGKVNALALDAQIALLVEQINALIRCLGVIRQSRGRLADGVVTPRQLSDACNNDLADLLLVIAKLRRQYTNSYDPRAAITSAPTITDATDTIPFFIGQAPPVPDFTAPMTLDGIPGRKYAMTMRMRSVARGSAVVAVGASAPGFNAENRLYLGTAVAPVGSARERVGVQHPDGYAYINALDQAAESGAADGGYADWDSGTLPATIKVTFTYTRGASVSGCTASVAGLASTGTIPDTFTATLTLSAGAYSGSVVVASVPNRGDNGDSHIFTLTKVGLVWVLDCHINGGCGLNAIHVQTSSPTLRGGYADASGVGAGICGCPFLPVKYSAITVHP